MKKESLQQTVGVGSPALRMGKILPEKRERDAWWAFVIGMPEYEWNKPAKPARSAKKRKKAKSKLRDTSPPSDVEDTYEIQLHDQVIEEVYRVDEDGEVQLSNYTEPTESSPPTATERSPAYTDNGHADTNQTSIADGHDQLMLDPKPREPTPTILSMLDNVCAEVFLDLKYASMIFSAILYPFVDVFQLLDQAVA